MIFFSCECFTRSKRRGAALVLIRTLMERNYLDGASVPKAILSALRRNDRMPELLPQRGHPVMSIFNRVSEWVLHEARERVLHEIVGLEVTLELFACDCSRLRAQPRLPHRDQAAESSVIAGSPKFE